MAPRVHTCCLEWRVAGVGRDRALGRAALPGKGACDGSQPQRRLGLVASLFMGGPPLPCSVTWEPTGDGKKVISLADNHILLWDLQESSSQAVVSDKLTVFTVVVF